MIFFPKSTEIFDRQTHSVIANHCLGLCSFDLEEGGLKYHLSIVLLSPSLIKRLGKEDEGFATPFRFNLTSNQYTLCTPLESIRNQLEDTDVYFESLQKEYDSVKEQYFNGTYLYSELIETSFEYAAQVEFPPAELIYDEHQKPMKFIGSLFLGNILMDLGTSIDVYLSPKTSMIKLHYQMG